MNIEKFEQDIAILNKLMEEKMNEPQNDRFIISDGVMKPDLYFSNSIRLAWMLKEPYDSEEGTGGGWSYFDMFPDGENLYDIQFKKGHKTTWHPIIYISFSIFNGFQKWEEMEYIKDKNEMCDIVRQVAFVNSQKLPSKGITNTNFDDLIKAVSKHSYLIKSQIDLLDPNVLIFGNTISLYGEMLDVELDQMKNFGSCDYLIKNKKLYISAYHPSQRAVKRAQYVNDIIKLVEAWSNNNL